MTTEEAKLVLRAYRPADKSPLVQRALNQAEHDPELAAWLAEQQAFDRSMMQSLAEAPIPPHLRDSILHERPTTKVLYLTRIPLLWGLAAALVLGGIVFALLYEGASKSIGEFRTAMIQELWTIDDQAKFRSSTTAELRRWLQSHGSAANFTLPPALKELRVRDARIVNWSHQKVASLCLIGHGRHLHLFVVPTAALDAPALTDAPQVEVCHGLETVVWTHGDNTYLLSGVNCVSFIKNNRRAGYSPFTG